jgi:hypothetical protein
LASLVLFWLNVLRRVVKLSVIYLAVYLLVSNLDLHTTLLALQMPGTNEGNVYATSGRDYVAAKAWLITAAGALFVEAFCFSGR